MDNAAEAVEATPIEVVDTDETKDWRVDAGINNNPQFDKFETPADLAKSYAELEHYRGNSIRIPTTEAGEEQMNEFQERLLQVPGVTRIPDAEDKSGWDNIYQQLGRPNEAKGYEFEPVEGFSDPEAEGELKALAHELGLNKDQAAKIHSHFASKAAEGSTVVADKQAKEMAELKGEWGQAFDHKFAMAQTAAAQMEEKVPGISAYFDQMASNGYDASLIRLMDVVGDLMGETGAISGTPRTAMTREEAQNMIRDIRDNPNHPANNELDPRYDEAREKYMALYKAAYS